MTESVERLAAISEALDAATAALARARERNVPRGVPRAVARFGPLAPVAMRAYNRLFVVQREIAADQNDALVAVVNAMRELVLTIEALRDERDPSRE